MNKKTKIRFKHGPESEQFGKFKGREVIIKVPPYLEDVFDATGARNLVGNLSGKLVWVDVYTMGVIFSGATEPSIIYKGPGMVVSLA